MALPPSMPTSFVPRPSTNASRGFHMDFIGAFGFLAYAILAVSIVLAVGVFIYGQILNATLSSKDAALAAAEKGIDSSTAQSFVRLHDRLAQGKTLLSNHTAFSTFFTAVAQLLPTSVRFNTLALATDAKGKITVSGAGAAKSFNALAATSANFAADGRIKDAIFSHLTVNKDNSVSFSFTATLDQAFVTFAAPVVAAPKAATTTATTTAKTTATTTAKNTAKAVASTSPAL